MDNLKSKNIKGSFNRNEPSFGAYKDISEKSERSSNNIKIDRDRNENKSKKRRKRRTSGWISAFLYLVLFSGIGYGGYYGYSYYAEGHVSLDGFNIDPKQDSAGDSVKNYVEPESDQKGILTSENIRWCLKQQLILESLMKIASTNTEISKLNASLEQRASLCDFSEIAPEIIATEMVLINANEERIITQAIDEQLIYFGTADVTSWSRSETVSQVQRLLDDLGYDIGSADGLWGAKTKTAIKSFQRDADLPLTGVVDKKLVRDLKEAVRQKTNNT